MSLFNPEKKPDSTWSVRYGAGYRDRVAAQECGILEAGDLVFYDGRGLLVRAFAAGQWLDVEICDND